jgi:hypothetical protein
MCGVPVIDTDKLKAYGAKHGPAMSVAMVASVIAARLAAPTIPPPAPTFMITAPGSHARATHLMGCGDATAAIVGNDHGGSVTAGAGADGRCTVMFADRWPTTPTCWLTCAGAGCQSGAIVKVTPYAMALTGLDSGPATYICEPGK